MKNVAESNFICFKFLLFSLLWHWFCKIIPGYHTGPFNTRMTELGLFWLSFFWLKERKRERISYTRLNSGFGGHEKSYMSFYFPLQHGSSASVSRVQVEKIKININSYYYRSNDSIYNIQVWDLFNDMLGIQSKDTIRWVGRTAWDQDKDPKAPKTTNVPLPNSRLPEKQSCTSIELNICLILHYQGTTNTLEGPCKRSNKPCNPAAHENNVANNTGY